MGVLYNKWKERTLDGDVKLLTDTINAALLTNAYTPNIDTHEFWAGGSGINGSETSGTGYSAGGQALATKTRTKNTTNDRGEFDAADVTWASSTITARYWVIYKTGTAGVNDWLIGYEDMSTDKSSNNGNFTIQWNSTGILHIT